MTKCYAIAFVSIWVMLGSAVAAQAVGIGVKPQRLIVQTAVSQAASESILVSNITDAPTLYHVGLKQPNRSITITPTDFRLEAGSSQLVLLTVQSWRPSTADDIVQVVGRSLNNGGSSTAVGVQIPFHQVVTVGAIGMKMALAIFLIFCIGAVFLLKWYMRQQKIHRLLRPKILN